MRQNTLSRRSFFGQTAIAAGATALGWAETGVPSGKEPLKATSIRPLGKTGLATTALGIGRVRKHGTGVAPRTVKAVKGF